MVSWADLVFWPWVGGVLASMGGLSGPPPRGPEEAWTLTVRAVSREGVRCSKLLVQVAHPTQTRKAQPGSVGQRTAVNPPAGPTTRSAIPARLSALPSTASTSKIPGEVVRPVRAT